MKDVIKNNPEEFKDYPLKYTGEDCPNCGRLRVERWTNGNRICEKCNWNLDKKKYEKSYI